LTVAFVNAISKSGTHLAMRCVSLLPGMSHGVICKGPLPYLSPDNSVDDLKATLDQFEGAGYFCGHVGFSPPLYSELQRRRVKTLIIVRDPRDVAVSTVLWVRGFPLHTMHQAIRAMPLAEALRLTVDGGLIAGSQTLQVPSLASLYNRMTGWRNRNEVTLLKYEHLIGRLGGGNKAKQKLELKKLADHLEVFVDNATISTIIDSIEASGHEYTKNPNNFLRGQIGLWNSGLVPLAATKSLWKRLRETAADWGYN
jgi:hypothetical protein